MTRAAQQLDEEMTSSTGAMSVKSAYYFSSLGLGRQLIEARVGHRDRPLHRIW